MEEICINLHKNVYSPGQQVTGNLEIYCQTPVKAGMLGVFIRGASDTAWFEEESRARFVRNIPRVEKVKVQYSGEEMFVMEKDVLWMGGEEGILPSGASTFPFSFTLPSNCPSSFDGANGGISYSVNVIIGNPKVFEKDEKLLKKHFRVISPIDTPPNQLSQPVSESVVQKKTSPFKFETITLTVTIPRAGYTPGEIVPITLEINNQSTGHVDLALVSLYQTQNCLGVHPLDSAKRHIKKKHLSLAHDQKQCFIFPRTKRTFEMYMRIPEGTPPTSMSSQIIKVMYSLVVFLNTTMIGGECAKCVLPIVIHNAVLGSPVESEVQSSAPEVTAPPPYEGNGWISQIVPPPEYSSIVPSAPGLGEADAVVHF